MADGKLVYAAIDGRVDGNGRSQLISGAGDVVQGFDPGSGTLIWSVQSRGEGVVPARVNQDSAWQAGDDRIRFQTVGMSRKMQKQNGEFRSGWKFLFFHYLPCGRFRGSFQPSFLNSYGMAVKLIRKRESTLAQRRERAQAAGRQVHSLHKQMPPIVQLSLQFIRTLCNYIAQGASLAASLARFEAMLTNYL